MANIVDNSTIGWNFDASGGRNYRWLRIWKYLFIYHNLRFIENVYVVCWGRLLHWLTDKNVIFSKKKTIFVQNLFTEKRTTRFVFIFQFIHIIINWWETTVDYNLHI